MIDSLTVGYFVVFGSAVAAMVASGCFVGILVKMYPVETSNVTAYQSGLGGTGDVAILSASNRMGLMPFAQISTLIGGASMAVMATLLLRLSPQAVASLRAAAARVNQWQLSILSTGGSGSIPEVA